MPAACRFASPIFFRRFLITSESPFLTDSGRVAQTEDVIRHLPTFTKALVATANSKTTRLVVYILLLIAILTQQRKANDRELMSSLIVLSRRLFFSAFHFRRVIPKSGMKKQKKEEEMLRTCKHIHCT